MAENYQKSTENEIRYVWGDQQYVLGEDVNGELTDFICSDGSRAILVDGQYIVTDNQTIFLQDGGSNLTQYYINDNSESFIIDNENSLFSNTEFVQLVEEDTSDGQEIIYYEPTEEVSPAQEISDDVEGIQDEDGNIYPFKRIKLGGQMLNFDELVQKQGNLVIDHQPVEKPDIIEAVLAETQQLDLSKITGRNLITGQTVTLHSYMEKLKKKLKTGNIDFIKTVTPTKKMYDDVQKPDLCSLLDRKISIGRTKSGKKVVGKIIRVERRSQPAEESSRNENYDMVVDYSEFDDRLKAHEEPNASTKAKVLVKQCTMSKDGFEQISKTLGGVMEMESVRKKLEDKNIVVKFIEKRYVSDNDTFVKNTLYSYGYMERDLSHSVDNEVMEKWKFVPDRDTQDALLGNHIKEEVSEDKPVEKKSMKFPVTTSLTILISQSRSGNRTIRVNLNPAPGNVCTMCAQYFKNNSQLRQHLHNAHNTYGNNSICEVCTKSFTDLDKLQEHRDMHIQEGKLFICSECSKCFMSVAKLQKHLPTHDLHLRPLECSVCEVRCANEWTLKKHLLTHTGIKPFPCDICHKQFLTEYDVNFHKKIHFPDKHFACTICLRTFSRHSNLLRHMAIHQGSEALYKCDICLCSFNYISSLTRHIVQNHIDAGDGSQKT